IVPDLWLCFAPIKKTRTDFIAEKACELGCSRIIPVFTHHTNAERVRADRLRAHAVEAAEQCGLTSVPDVAEPLKLGLMLDHWPADRQIMFCDETRTGPDARSVLERADPGPWAVLTGPEGGFSGDEVQRLRRMPQAHSVSLGPRILRADTAAVAALALWQTALGDWR
ncbi:MAG: 16S rRNA (uracil(1498)-N(3))-methyltransferase, partial [Pseudomonadota bacterium]